MAYVYPVAIAMTLVVLTWSLLAEKKKKDKKAADGAGPVNGSGVQEPEPAHHKKHKSLHHRLGLKKDKESKRDKK
jgi:hypothetical protein